MLQPENILKKKRMGLIRKISIGPDYKTAMHYSIGQEVYGGHKIVDIFKKDNGEYLIMIEKENEVKEWKGFNNNVAVSWENNLDY